MARLAWFTPLPPATSGIAQYSAELLPRLAPEFQIDVFIDGRPSRPGPFAGAVGPAPGLAVWNAHDFLWKHAQQPYDLVVYQLGNAPCHDYMWGYLVRYPGLVVLHDGQLHHARARCLLRQKRDDDYRAEFRFNHPGARRGVAELGVAGMLGSLTYLWPMVGTAVESARLTVVHNQWLADQIGDAHPDAAVRVVEMGVPPVASRVDGAASVRARHGISRGAALFVAFGRVTPEKRISPVIQALASVAADVPDVHLLLVGETADYYDARAEAGALGIADKVTIGAFVPEEEMADYLAAADVCLCLRWPTSRETSASWLRCLAAGRPTVITDLAQTVDIPALDPSWKPRYAPRRSSAEGAAATPAAAACVGIDILDEDHSLRLAMRRLATDARLRETLGSSARQLWSARFTLDGMASGYRDAIHAACAVPVPDLAARRARLPAHLLTDGSEHASRLLREAGLPQSRIEDIWRSSASGSR